MADNVITIKYETLFFEKAKQEKNKEKIATSKGSLWKKIQALLIW